MASVRLDIADKPCPGGGHVTMTLTTPVGSSTTVLHVSEISEPPSEDDLVVTAKTLARLMGRQLEAVSHDAIRKQIHGKVLDITPKPEGTR